MPSPSIALIVPYFGRWPLWMPAFLRTCATNADIDWLFFTDLPAPPHAPLNVRFLPFTLAELNRRATERCGTPVQKTAYTQVDLKPAYGDIFAAELAGYDFWGHADIDVLWGHLRRFFPDETLAAHDVISSRLRATSGHFTLFRNAPAATGLYRLVPGWEAMFADPGLHAFDESKISRHLRALLAEGRAPVRVAWDEELVVDRPELNRRPHGWHWRDGRVLDARGRERAYLHFAEWKHTFQPPALDPEDCAAARYFALTRYGVHLRPVSRWEHLRTAWRVRRQRRAMT